jgi:hypothetical protein
MRDRKIFTPHFPPDAKGTLVQEIQRLLERTELNLDPIFGMTKI